MVVLPVVIRDGPADRREPALIRDEMIAVAVSCSYLTPIESSCLMIYEPGQYRFTDFLISLTVCRPFSLVAIMLVPRV
jgi:di/tricarboxylate transporter